MSDELAQKPTYEAELEKVQAELSRIEASTREKESILNELRQKKESLDSKKAQLDELEIRLHNASKDLERWEHQVKQHHARLAEYEQVIGRRGNIVEGYAQFTESKKMNEELDQKFRQSVRLEKAKTQLETRINDAGHQLNREHAVVQHEISSLETSVQKLPELNHQLSQVQIQIHQLPEPEANLRQKEQDNQKLQAQINHLESENKRLEREINELAEKIDLISAHTEAKCPLCETELTIEGLKLIESKYLKEKQEKSDSLKSHRAELAQMQTRLEEQQKTTAKQESALNQEKTKAQSQLSILTKEIAETEADEKKLAALKKTLENIEQRLAKRDFALAEQEALASIEAELVGLVYDSEKHEKVRLKLKQFEAYEHEQRRLEEAEKLIGQEKEAAATAQETAEGIRNSLKAESERKAVLTSELTGYPQLLDNLAQAETEYRSITALRSQAQEALGSVKAKIQRCAELEVRKKEKEEKLSLAVKEVNIYRELTKAFGKTGGIQTLLIEQAIPEIENEANRLLARLTDGRMNVKFDTQKDTKKGTVQETLDINIDDGGGTRNYEMFSGGEAFRIDFAIRIALSKLLARRAGAPLPTLIIDEGFGTQDNTGIEKLKEAINSIQDDFKKILVITHIEELRDAFPTRIDVIKTADGSTITVS
jgi:exonuclease SbcC